MENIDEESNIGYKCISCILLLMCFVIILLYMDYFN